MFEKVLCIQKKKKAKVTLEMCYTYSFLTITEMCSLKKKS